MPEVCSCYGRWKSHQMPCWKVQCYIVWAVKWDPWSESVVSGGLNGGRLYLGKKELTCSIELFMMGIAGSRLVKASTHVIVKWVAPADGGCGAVEINLLAAYWGSLLAELKWGRAVTSVWFGSIICSLKWCVYRGGGPKLLWQQFPHDPKRYGTIQTGNKEYGSSD